MSDQDFCPCGFLDRVHRSHECSDAAQTEETGPVTIGKSWPLETAGRRTERPEPPEGPVLPKGPWQEPSAGLRLCTQHRNLCAYRQGDPDRCDVCHADFVSIEVEWQDAGSREAHQAGHDVVVNRVARQRAKERAE